MKKKFLKYSLDAINSNGKYNEEKLEEIAYGLETVYLTVTKLIVIFGLAYILGIFKEMLCLLICFNLIRCSSYGLHASRSIYCLISSILMFIGGVYISNFIAETSIYIKIVLGIIAILMLFIYAPADTEKRPLINAKKRKKLKLVSSIKGIIYLLLIIIFKDNIVSGYLLFGLIEAVIIIHPGIYKIFNLPYNNYKNYNCGV